MIPTCSSSCAKSGSSATSVPAGEPLRTLYSMHSIACTALHAQRDMHSTANIARHTQHAQHSIACTALHAQHYMPSTACTALHAQPILGSAPLQTGVANPRGVEGRSAGRRLLPERHIGCAPGLPSWPQSPPCRSRLHPSCVGQPCQKRSATCPALTQYCMYISQTALRTHIFVLHYAMHSTRWTDLHARH